MLYTKSAEVKMTFYKSLKTGINMKKEKDNSVPTLTKFDLRRIIDF